MSSGFLQYSSAVNYNSETKIWTLKELPIDSKKTYHVAISDFLMTGGEANMEFLTKDNPEISKVYPVISDIKDPRSDARLAIIKYLLEYGK